MEMIGKPSCAVAFSDCKTDLPLQHSKMSLFLTKNDDVGCSASSLHEILVPDCVQDILQKMPPLLSGTTPMPRQFHLSSENVRG